MGAGFLSTALWMLAVLALAIYMDGLRSYDNTDDVEGEQRSGLGLYTDYGTGCQYIKGGWLGGITPRMEYVNGDYQHICNNY